MESPLEEIKDETEMNILLWAALLHDIAKIHKYDTPDWSHPFLSAALTVKVFRHLGLLHFEVEEVSSFIESAVERIPSKSYWKKASKVKQLNPAPN